MWEGAGVRVMGRLVGPNDIRMNSMGNLFNMRDGRLPLVRKDCMRLVA